MSKTKQPKVATYDADDLQRRALAAYFKAAGDGVLQQPAANASGAVEHEGKVYVVLRNTRGVLAVYRHRNTGLLRRLRRWPQALNG